MCENKPIQRGEPTTELFSEGGHSPTPGLWHAPTTQRFTTHLACADPQRFTTHTPSHAPTRPSILRRMHSMEKGEHAPKCKKREWPFPKVFTYDVTCADQLHLRCPDPTYEIQTPPMGLMEGSDWGRPP